VVNFSGRRDRKMMISLNLEGLLMLSHSCPFSISVRPEIVELFSSDTRSVNARMSERKNSMIPARTDIENPQASTKLLRQLSDSSEENPAREIRLPPELPPMVLLQSLKFASDQRSTSVRNARPWDRTPPSPKSSRCGFWRPARPLQRFPKSSPLWAP